MEKKIKKGFLKSRKFACIIVGIITFILGCIIGGSGSNDQTQVTDLTNKLAAANATVTLVDGQNATLKQQVAEAAPYFALTKDKQEAMAAEVKAKEAAAEKAAAEKAAAEKTAAARKLAEGYNTGITFNQLARTPDKYTDSKVKFSGQVLQVMTGDDGSTQLRVAVNDDYNDIMLAQYSSDIVSSRVLEDDEVTLRGTSTGLITYKSTLGGNITIPSMNVDQLKDNTNS